MKFLTTKNWGYFTMKAIVFGNGKMAVDCLKLLTSYADGIKTQV